MTKKLLCEVCGSRASTYQNLQKHVLRVHPGAECPPRSVRRATKLTPEDARARWRAYAAKRTQNGHKAVYDRYNRLVLRLGPRPDLLGEEPPADILPDEPKAPHWEILCNLSLDELEKLTLKRFEALRRQELSACAPDSRPRISRLRYSQVAVQQAIRYRVTEAAVNTVYKKIRDRVQDEWDTARRRIEHRKEAALAHLSVQQS